MATVTAILPERSTALKAPVRVLHGWHLLSLDAPTVAFTWTLAFAHVGRVTHALPAALALAGAVWIVYVTDRLLDVSGMADVAHPLPAMYLRHAGKFLLACIAVAVLTTAMLMAAPLKLVTLWAALGLPMLLYAVAVHRFRMPGTWKNWCVGLFFAVAVSLPVLVHVGLQWDWAAASLAFGAVCLENCRLLRASATAAKAAWTTEAVLCQIWTLLPLFEHETQSIALACAAAMALLATLHRMRARLSPLTFRALADAALVVPALLILLVP